MDRNVFPSIEIPIKIRCLCYLLICMADMMAHYHGTYAAQILIILPEPPTIIPEWWKVESYEAYSW